MMEKLLGASWEIKLNGIIAVLGMGVEIANALGIAETKAGRWLVAIALIINTFRTKSVAQTGIKDRATRDPAKDTTLPTSIAEAGGGTTINTENA